MRHAGVFQNLKTTARKHGITTQFPRKKAIYTTNAIRLREPGNAKTPAPSLSVPARMEILVSH